ncbi:hypothetical protein L596_007735 [Steinernema carpocapsae]|uniref:Uncharacterized protein n=1 Tax=Steinernema carpocapsae TaxID=34508 RepID=A0A4U5PAT8_STECR|nr:hypothetical protein L596_007735 [Steinernema carpocapsae]
MVRPLMGELDAGWFANTFVVAQSEPSVRIPDEELPTEGKYLDDVHRLDRKPLFNCCQKNLHCDQCNDGVPFNRYDLYCTSHTDYKLYNHRRLHYTPRDLPCEDCNDGVLYSLPRRPIRPPTSGLQNGPMQGLERRDSLQPPER